MPQNVMTARRRPIAVVTGASAGVGRATVRELAHRGFDVGLLARGTVGLDAARREVEAIGGRAVAVETDVADADAVERAADAVERELGPIDVWVNVAMTTVFARVDDVTPAEFERTTQVTYLGQVYGTMAALRRMRERDRGVIVSVGSALAFRAIALQAPYCGSKFATRGFHDSLRAELRHDGSRIRIVQVHLPAVDTPQFDWCRNKMGWRAMPAGPIYRPEVAARAIVDALERPRRQRIVGVWNGLLVRANNLMPGVVDHFAALTTLEDQQTDERLPPDAPDNLDAPLDGPAGRDYGAAGSFGDQTGGMVTWSFVRSIPSTVRNLATAVARRASEVRHDWSPSGSPTAPDPGPDPRPDPR